MKQTLNSSGGGQAAYRRGDLILNPADRVLSRKAAAVMLGVSERTLERQALDGDGCQFVKIGARVGYRMSDLCAYLDARTFTSTSAATMAAKTEAV